MKISDLSDIQKQHLAWRLDTQTGCGYLTAISVARMDHGDLDLVGIFVDYRGRSLHSAKIHAAKVRKYTPPEL